METHAPQRIVSLLASGTELVCALGIGDRLVGRSHECDTPPWVKGLPALSRPTFEVEGTSGDIDARVRERLRAGEPLYEIDEVMLASLQPDVIITQTHCEVCAVSDNQIRGPWEGPPSPPRWTPLGKAQLPPRADLAHGLPAKLQRRRVVALETGTIDGILDSFASVAGLLGVSDEGEKLIADIRTRLAAVADRTRTLPHPRVACLEWIDPLFAMGNWGPQLVELAGAVSLLGTAGERSTSTTWQDLVAADPDVIVIAPCGFGIDRTLADLPVLTSRPGWTDLRAVREGRVFVADGNFYFNRSGPMLFETPEILAEILHPADFPPRHEGTTWRRIS